MYLPSSNGMLNTSAESVGAGRPGSSSRALLSFGVIRAV